MQDPSDARATPAINPAAGAMSRLAAVALTAAALALAGALRWELQGDAPDEPAPVPRIEAHPDGAAPLPAVDRAAQVAAATGRPLFEPSRRPPADLPVAASAPAVRTVPRVTGVLVSGTERTAIFAAPGAGAPMAAREGGRVGEYTVQRIAAGQVTLTGPDGPLTLRPAFDRNRPPPAPAPPAPLGAWPAPPLPLPPPLPPAG